MCVWLVIDEATTLLTREEIRRNRPVSWIVEAERSISCWRLKEVPLMPVWVWVLIAIGVVVVLGVLAWNVLARRRTSRLQGRFGPEYDRVVGTAENKREAESDLAAREERRAQLGIRPLSPAARARYSGARAVGRHACRRTRARPSDLSLRFGEGRVRLSPNASISYGYG